MFRGWIVEQMVMGTSIFIVTISNPTTGERRLLEVTAEDDMNLKIEEFRRGESNGQISSTLVKQ